MQSRLTAGASVIVMHWKNLVFSGCFTCTATCTGPSGSGAGARSHPGWSGPATISCGVSVTVGTVCLSSCLSANSLKMESEKAKKTPLGRVGWAAGVSWTPTTPRAASSQGGGCGVPSSPVSQVFRGMRFPACASEGAQGESREGIGGSNVCCKSSSAGLLSPSPSSPGAGSDRRGCSVSKQRQPGLSCFPKHQRHPPAPLQSAGLPGGLRAEWAASPRAMGGSGSPSEGRSPPPPRAAFQRLHRTSALQAPEEMLEFTC